MRPLVSGEGRFRGDFNPRTPVGCDERQRPDVLRRPISIHAPQWGATCACHCLMMVSASFQSTHPSGVRLALVARFARTFLFQSTHPSGVRPSKRGLLSVANYFNPRTPVGCDRGDDAVRWTGAISIHAPQWGATGIDMPAKTDPVFQSTHPSGVRRSRCSTCFSGRRDFNPRTPVGCDAPILGAVSYADGFQSTHPSGVRHDTGAFCAATYEFQSTHPSGVRRNHPAGTRTPGRFQSTHPSGVRQ